MQSPVPRETSGTWGQARADARDAEERAGVRARALARQEMSETWSYVRADGRAQIAPPAAWSRPISDLRDAAPVAASTRDLHARASSRERTAVDVRAVVSTQSHTISHMQRQISQQVAGRAC